MRSGIDLFGQPLFGRRIPAWTGRPGHGSIYPSPIRLGSYPWIYDSRPDFARFQPERVKVLLFTSTGYPYTDWFLHFQPLASDDFGRAEPAINRAAAVPEPSTWLLLGLGLAGFGSLRRRLYRL